MKSQLTAMTVGFLSFSAVSACGGKDAVYTPPAIGTELNWRYEYEGEVELAKTEVIATGPDFAIHQDIDSTGEGYENYFVEFSGIDFKGCVDDMMSRQDRQALAAAWPLKAGTVLEFGEHTLSIADAPPYKLGGAEIPVFSIEIDYKDPDSPNDTFLFSKNLMTVVGNTWGAGGKDRAYSVQHNDVQTIEIKSGYSIKMGFDVTKLESCADLLTAAE